jgi:hypothetical protein
MNNIEEYRKRFNSLLESTMGDVRPLISEQSETSPQLPQSEPPLQYPKRDNSKPISVTAEEIKYLKRLQQELEYAKDQLEDEKELVGGTLLSRIKDYFKVRKLRRQNEKLESQLRLLEKDIQRYKDGKVIGNENGGLIATIGIIITYITGIIAGPDLEK